MATEPHIYTAFGLAWSLPFECDEPVAAVRAVPPDVHVTWGDVPKALDGAVARGAWYHAAPGAVLFTIAGVARFLAAHGRSVTVAPDRGAPLTDISFYLFGVCAGALLHQRGALALHASAVVTPRGAVVFTGRKGAGKSTLLGELVSRGHLMLADDIVAVTRPATASGPRAQPGFPLIKLWDDAARALDLDPAGLRPLVGALAKSGVPVQAGFCQTDQPIRGVYVLDVPAGGASRQLSGVDAFQAIVSHVYGAPYVHRLGMGDGPFSLAAELARGVPVRVMTQPDRAGDVRAGVSALADHIEQDLRSL